MVFGGWSDRAKNQCAFNLIFLIKCILFIPSKFFGPIRGGASSTYAELEAIETLSRSFGQD